MGPKGSNLEEAFFRFLLLKVLIDLPRFNRSDIAFCGPAVGPNLMLFPTHFNAEVIHKSGMRHEFSMSMHAEVGCWGGRITEQVVLTF